MIITAFSEKTGNSTKKNQFKEKKLYLEEKMDVQKIGLLLIMDQWPFNELSLYFPKVILAVNITVKMQGDGVFINYEITELFTINFTLPIMLLQK